MYVYLRQIKFAVSAKPHINLSQNHKKIKSLWFNSQTFCNNSLLFTQDLAFTAKSISRHI